MKQYWLTFGSGDPRTNTGLAPTFIQFFNQLGATLPPPGVSEVFAGSGAYNFQYAPSASLSIFFLVSGVTTGLSANDRFIKGSIDPVQTVDIPVRDMGTTLVATGNTLAAIGTSILGTIGTTASSFGSTSVDPASVFGYVKRLQEVLEGSQTFNKSSGIWSLYSRGASTLLSQKTVTDSTTGVTRT